MSLDPVENHFWERLVTAVESIDAKLPSAQPDPKLSDDRIAEARDALVYINSSMHGRAVETLEAALKAAEALP
jgi:hypothetical protein